MKPTISLIDCTKLTPVEIEKDKAFVSIMKLVKKGGGCDKKRKWFIEVNPNHPFVIKNIKK